MRRSDPFHLATLTLCLFASLAERSSADEASAGAGPTFKFVVSQAVDLNYYLRSLADLPPEQTPEAYRPGVAAVRALEKDMGRGFGWAFIEGELIHYATAAEAHDAFDKLPARIHRRDGLAVKARVPARLLAKAYLELEPTFATDLWPKHREAIEAARTRLTDGLLPKAPECFQFIADSLGMKLHTLELPVALVMIAPPPQGVTYQRRDGSVSFIGVEGLEGSLLFEVVLHEAMHSLDNATLDQTTVLADVSKALREAGHGAYSPAARDVPHTILFVQAAETVRRFIDPNHQDYGDARGYYEKLGPWTRTVRTTWLEHLAGKISRAEAVARIVAAAPPPPQAAQSQPASASGPAQP